MVEILGVLSIMGILGLVGLKMYHSAVNRHRANELVYEANKRAVMVAMQITAGQTNLSIAEFKNTTGNGTFEDVSYREGDETFAMSLLNVDPDVCQQMKAMVDENSSMAVIGDCQAGSELNLQFNKDLRQGVPGIMLSVDGWKGDKTDAGCRSETKPTVASGKKACSVCVKSGNSEGEWYDSDALCGQNQVCVDGACSETLTGTGCTKNSDCSNKTAYDGTDCGKSGCFCGYYTSEAGSYENIHYAMGPQSAAGICFKLSAYKASDSKESYVWSTKKMDWFSAKNFCRACHKEMISLSSVPCPYTGAEYRAAVQQGRTYCCESAEPNISTRCAGDTASPGVRAMRKAGRTTEYHWLKDRWSDRPGVVFSLGIHGSDISYDDRNGAWGILYAMCQ